MESETQQPLSYSHPSRGFDVPNGDGNAGSGSRSRGRRGRAKPEIDSSPAPEEFAPVPQEASGDGTTAKAKRRRGNRGGRRHRKAADKATEAAPEPVSDSQGVATPTRTRTRRVQPKPSSNVPDARPPRAERSARPAIAKARARIPVTGAPTEHVPAPFAHNAEYEFARILDFYGIDWQYEPRSFPLRWERGHVSEAFTPDFYLPDLNLYVELTTLKTSLTAEKNRKMRLLKELYPEVNVIMLKKRDYLRLLAKYGYGPLSPGQVPDIDRVLLTATKIQQRVGQLGAQISRDYAGKEPVLVGVLRGVMCFMADLMRHISVPTAMDLMAISSYEGNGAGAVRILKDLDENIKGRDVILVEDIVDTGMTLNHVIDYLQTKRPASIRVCTLLDKRARRIVNVPLDYVAFEVPDEFVVGYGLDFHQRFRNLPFIAVLKHDLLP
ncbi:MAG TPA: hypoxanthine phosphoribosyltransferase [Dehalococcoidia bacterium]|jgi:hypoxanthine phosphoribosyltransferase|nr:hypoxanthine phosphoribosyltransferase [Dehalococcoidia bacterium]